MRSVEIVPSPATTTWTFDQFCRAEDAWTTLVAESAHPLPFLSHPWLRLWWKHFGLDQEFVAVVVHQEERLIAALPLAVRRLERFGRRLNLVEIVGTGPVPTRGMGLADKVDAVVHRDASPMWGPLAAELYRMLGRTDVLDIKGVDEHSPFLAELANLAPRRPAARAFRRSLSPYLDLSGSGSDYLASRSRNFRKHLKKYTRLLAEAGTVEIRRLTPGEDPRPWLPQVSAVSDASWKADRGTNLFRATAVRDFMQELILETAVRGWLDLWRLDVGEECVAYELCFDFGGRIYSYDGSFRKAFARSSPGTVLTTEIVKSACERGRVEYDMLRGDEDYKGRWSAGSRAESQVVMPSERWLARAWARFVIELKERLRNNSVLREVDDRVSGLVARMRYRD